MPACHHYTISLCKVRCDTQPCSTISCETGVSDANFPGTIPAEYGGAISDPYKLITVLGVTPIQNGNLKTGNSYPDCRGAGNNFKDCYTWSTTLSTGNRILYYIVITNTPIPTNTPLPTNTPTPNPNWIKLKNTSFYSPRSLTQSIPAFPASFDSDDDATPYFIISSPASDPGLTSASSIYLGTASVSASATLYSLVMAKPSPCRAGDCFPHASLHHATLHHATLVANMANVAGVAGMAGGTCASLATTVPCQGDRLALLAMTYFEAVAAEQL